MLIGVILCCLMLSFEITAAPSPKKCESHVASNDRINYRLPNNTRPVAYNISFRTGTCEGNFDYDGSISIEILIVNATREVTIHSRELKGESFFIITRSFQIVSDPLWIDLFNFFSQASFTSDVDPLISPMTRNVENPESVRDIVFDNHISVKCKRCNLISAKNKNILTLFFLFCTAACVIRMFSEALTEASFRKGLINYLANKYECINDFHSVEVIYWMGFISLI